MIKICWYFYICRTTKRLNQLLHSSYSTVAIFLQTNSIIRYRNQYPFRLTTNFNLYYRIYYFFTNESMYEAILQQRLYNRIK